MAFAKSIGRILFACSLVFALICAAGCGREDREEHKSGGIWFIHATDPHIFLYTAQDQDKNNKAVGEEQQKLDEKALSDMLQHISSLPSDGRPPAFIVLTGDLGVEPCSITSVTPVPAGSPSAQVPTKNCVTGYDKQKRADQVDRTAELLGQSPVRDIYLVAGNNDIPNEDAADIGLTYFNEFVGDVQKKITEKNKDVQLHNLTRCYVSSGSNLADCIADVSNTSYRLIGFPSYSFKNRDTGAGNLDPQEKQFAIFQGLLHDAQNAGKKVLVVSHIPEMDDPYTLAQQRYAAKPPNPALDKDSNNPRDSASTWNVSKKLLDEWENVLASDAVAGVLAGHLHDSHKEIYRQPYAWSHTSDQPREFSKLYLAPPLSVKNQDTSPIQARGFSLVHLTADRIEPSLYWYNSQTGDFRPDDSALQEQHRRGFLSRAIDWLWQLADFQTPLGHAAVLAIALLAAFLTVVQIFQIPPASDPLKGNGKGQAQPAGGSDNSGGAKTGDANPAFTPSPFASNFGKTVIAGLGGLAAETVLQSFGENKPTATDKEFYIVWFVIFLFLLLILLAASRAIVEAFRARLSMVYRSLPWIAGENRFLHWILNAKHWFLSLRFPFLAFLDTFVNLIQGKNQTRSTILTDKIVEQQRNVVHVAEAIRLQLNDLVLNQLAVHFNGQRPPQTDVRVNISVLSADLSNVFYITSAIGSAVKTFLKTSVAWVSVFTGKIRWYLDSYQADPNLFKEIILFDNASGKIPGGEVKLFLRSYFQQRDQDYKAFVVFPVPWPGRSFDENHVKGAIHISFHEEKQFKAIWNFQATPDQIKAARDEATQKADASIGAAPTQAEKDRLTASKAADIQQAVDDCNKLYSDPLLNSPNPPPYTFQNEDRLLKDLCSDDQVRVALQEAVAVLGELLNGFNENIYFSPGGPVQR